MRGPKDEGKVISPMFPRLHVNDTEKGGPRAPPRNKMALYEQLSIPSQRFSSGSASMLPLPPNNGNKLTKSSIQGDDFERGVFTPFCNSPASLHSEKPFSHSLSGVKLSTKMASQEQKSINSTNVQRLNTTQPLSSSANGNSYQSHNFSNFKNFSLKKFGEEKDSRVPSSSELAAVLRCSSSQHSKDQDNHPSWNLSFSNFSEKQMKENGSIGLEAREYMRNQTVENTKMSEAFQDPMVGSASVPSIQDKTSAGASSSPSSKVKSTESLKRAHPSSNQEHISSYGDVLKGLHGTNAQLNQNFVAMQDKTVLKDNILVKSAGGVGKDIVSKVRHESCSRLSLEDDNRSRNEIENGSRNHKDKQHGSLQVGEVERRDDVSESSMGDSIAALGITPDEVVRVIGEKQFWKARRAIVNQQRVFTVQVFELHRLIKVQKSIAGLPEILLEDNVYVGNASIKVSPARKVASDNAVEQPPLIDKLKDLQKPCSNAEFADENAVGKPPLPYVNNETSKELLTQRSNHVSHSESASPSPFAPNTRSSPWCFPPHGNQWLVPVMSPSEGLIYKPYAGPCPPIAGFMAPIYGNCGPAAGVGDFLNAAYGVPASHQEIGILPNNPPLGQTYTSSPYVMPVVSPSISMSAVEQVSPFMGPLSKDNRLSTGDINFLFPSHSSCNMSSQMSRVFSRCVGKFQASKESEVQGSTASSPSEKLKGDALPLFPTEPTAHASDQNVQPNEPRTHVIRVVPHNPRSATESAARIFQSIQEERKQYD